MRFKNRISFFLNLMGFLKDFIYLFLDRGKGGRKRGEKHRLGRVLTSCLLYVPRLGTETTTQACALTRDQTSDLLLCRKDDTQPTEPHGSGPNGFFKIDFRDRERKGETERERNIDLLWHLLMSSLVDYSTCPDRG